MIILVYSIYSSHNIRSNLGQPEYSYYFVLREYLPVLRKIGKVIEISDPNNEVDDIYASCLEKNEQCVFLSFMPPNKTPIGLRCPTIPVFAWEYDTLPMEPFAGKPRNDWRSVLDTLGGAITHSSYAANTVRRFVGDDFPVIVAPAPLWDRFASKRRMATPPGLTRASLTVDGLIVDSRITDLSPYSLAARPSGEKGLSLLPLPPERLLGENEIFLEGIIYTAVFNPGDGRKNWQDMITAFCIAFANVSDATLVLKLSHFNLDGIIQEILDCLYRTGDFSCRVLIIGAYLDDPSYDRLVETTAYAVNTSYGEGQCLPLMEYMSSGKPAISPRHTAMLDYIDESCAFVVESSPSIASWPHDQRQAFRTLRQNIHFGSLVKAYRMSFHLAKHEPESYRRMGEAAIAAMAAYCGEEIVRSRLENFLSKNHFENKKISEN